MTGSAEQASLTYILRDHDRALLERRKELAKAVKAKAKALKSKAKDRT